KIGRRSNDLFIGNAYEPAVGVLLLDRFLQPPVGRVVPFVLFLRAHHAVPPAAHGCHAAGGIVCDERDSAQPPTGHAMKKDPGLLQAILADPDDDAVRLVYADWLEESGRTAEEQARAEFIRLQIALDPDAEDSP